MELSAQEDGGDEGDKGDRLFIRAICITFLK
jgi:hypothetical protein